MPRYRVVMSVQAQDDLLRLHDWWLQTAEASVAQRALQTIDHAITLLQTFPHSCRKACGGTLGSAYRELLIPFGDSGYVALFRIQPEGEVQVLAVKHQRESDYH